MMSSFSIRSILYICDKNIVRSPMAEMLTKHLSCAKIFVDSVGLQAGDIDHFIYAVLEDLPPGASRGPSKTLEQVDGVSFDLVVALSQRAYAQAREAVTGYATRLEYWDVSDPSLITGNREVRLQAYRALRHELEARIRGVLNQTMLSLSP
ncbi:MAG: low molecular weight phosphatase family protein [Pseudomonadota bacterium]